jgi:NADH-quinone oxidoreductase subunit F
MLDDPHRLIEGMVIAGYAIGSTKGYIYVRGEYPYVIPVLENSLTEARAAGYLNEKFDIEVRVGAGAYICGEETALFESIEGKRGFPRIKPPFPTTNGLFDKPTVINNVETLFNVPFIISMGAAEYRKIGTEKSPGPKVFCISGDVTKPGLYEIPFGVSMRDLLDMAGGIANGKGLKSILFGGAAGAFATSQHLDVKMTFEDLRAAGLPLGSGVVMVFDETRDMRDVLNRLGHFFSHESCGKCYPCQMGTQRQKEILHRIAHGQTLPDDMVRLQDVGWTMTDASLCGLGQTAASAVLSAIQLWPELFKDEGGKAKDEGGRMKDEMGEKKEIVVKAKTVKTAVKKAVTKKQVAAKKSVKKTMVKKKPSPKKKAVKTSAKAKIATKKKTTKKSATKSTKKTAKKR